MKPLTESAILKSLSRTHRKPCMYVHIATNGKEDPGDFSEVYKAAPYLSYPSMMQIVFNSGGFIVFDSEEEMGRAYDQTVGDDGPTATNPYEGPASVYALTCHADGDLGTENT